MHNMHKINVKIISMVKVHIKTFFTFSPCCILLMSAITALCHSSQGQGSSMRQRPAKARGQIGSSWATSLFNIIVSISDVLPVLFAILNTVFLTENSNTLIRYLLIYPVCALFNVQQRKNEMALNSANREWLNEYIKDVKLKHLNSTQTSAQGNRQRWLTYKNGRELVEYEVDCFS